MLRLSKHSEPFLNNPLVVVVGKQGVYRRHWVASCVIARPAVSMAFHNITTVASRSFRKRNELGIARHRREASGFPVNLRPFDALARA